MPGIQVVLTNPRDPVVPVGGYITYENLGIGYVAATLRQAGFPVTIVDAYATGVDAADATREIAAARPGLVGLAGTYQSLDEAYRLARLVKAALPAAHICMGGEHATYSARGILEDEPAIDSICRGEGEQTFVELASRLTGGAAGGAADLDLVRGLTFRRGAGPGAEVRDNPPRPPLADLDSIPFPSRDTLDWCAANDRRGLIGLLGSRGCAYDCHFCNAFDFFRSGLGPALRKRSPKKIIDELEMLCRRYYDSDSHEPIHFYDANFVYPTPAGREWARAIAEEILARGLKLKFAVYCRADSFAEGDHEFAALLARAGLSSAFIGLEAGSQQMLERYHKRTSVDQNHWVLSFLQSHGVQTVTNGFIMFSPHSTLDDVRANARFLLETDQASFWNLTGRLQLFPGVKLIDTLRADGLLLPTYRHQRVHDYSFVDPLVALLVDRLSFVEHPTPLRENLMVRYMRMVYHEINRRLDAAGERRRLAADPLFNELGRAVEGKRRAIARQNYEFVMAAVELAAAGWDEAWFLAARDAYLVKFDADLDDLGRSFDRYLDYLDQRVSGGAADAAAESATP